MHPTAIIIPEKSPLPPSNGSEKEKWTQLGESLRVRAHVTGNRPTALPVDGAFAVMNGICAFQVLQDINSHFGNAAMVLQAKNEQKMATMQLAEEEVDNAPGQTFDDLYEDKESYDLLYLDPLKWRQQDHYGVLGLGKMRFRATEEEIKKAYRRKALRHHPDKTADAPTKSDNYFKCVQKAYEFMSEPSQRRLFDSVDPGFDDDIPSEADIRKHGFFATMQPVFARNSHFSKNRPCPRLGDENSTRQQVESFYAFWSKFQSWRSFELKDEETAREGDSRDERRWIEKQNKSERARRLKEERARINSLVDFAIRHDPRLVAIREQEQAEKDARKLAKRKDKDDALAAARAAELEAERLAKIKEEQEALAREKKKNKKSIIKACRRDIRAHCDKASASARGGADLDTVLKAAYVKMGDDTDVLENVMQHVVSMIPDKAFNFMQNYESGVIETPAAVPAPAPTPAPAPAEPVKSVKKEEVEPWSDDETKLLIKAVNMFPGGAQNRWQKIAEYLQNHSSSGRLRSADEIIAMSKIVKSSAFMAKASQLQGVEKKKEVVITDGPTIMYEKTNDSSNENSETPVAAAAQPNKVIWSSEQQSQLEAALKKYPGSYAGKDRWEKIAAMVDGRSKKEVLARVKEIVAALKK
eukprot:Partr_v1_DN26961_c2_g1_i1_m6746 putative Transcription factor